MKAYLLDAFRYTDFANRQMLQKIGALENPEACVRFFSHLINSQNKWMARIRNNAAPVAMSWWDPGYPLEHLETEWQNSLEAWVGYLTETPEDALLEEVQFTGFDGGVFAAKPKDIALQLIYHGIHHRAQMQLLIRAQGVEPDFIDYIGTVYRKIS